MDINYKQKYLKYKFKYLQLQQQGGTKHAQIFPENVPLLNTDEDEENKKLFEKEYKRIDKSNIKTVVLGTHGQRILCFLKQFLIKFKIFDFTKNKIRFKNCSMLSFIYLKELKLWRLSLVYDGELSNDKINKGGEYFVTTLTKTTSINNNYSEIILDPKYIQLPELDTYFDNNMELILCRHGDGAHTAAKTKNKTASLIKSIFSDKNNILYDPELSTDGLIQVNKSADEFITYIQSIRTDIHFIGSDLIRAIDTISIILARYNQFFYKGENPPIRSVSIVPCTHETNNDCDNISFLARKGTIENKTRCGYKKTRGSKILRDNEKHDCTTMNVKIKNEDKEEITKISINWQLYDEKYNNSKRGDKDGNKICIDENMMKIIGIELRKRKPFYTNK